MNIMLHTLILCDPLTEVVYPNPYCHVGKTLASSLGIDAKHLVFSDLVDFAMASPCDVKQNIFSLPLFVHKLLQDCRRVQVSGCG